MLLFFGNFDTIKFDTIKTVIEHFFFLQCAMFMHSNKILTCFRLRGHINFVVLVLLCHVYMQYKEDTFVTNKFSSHWNFVEASKNQ